MTHSPEPLRLLLADDHKLVRKSLKVLLSSWPDIEIVAEASTGREAVDLALDLMPDIILMDIDMPEMNGLTATRIIKDEAPIIKIVMLTVSDYDQDLFTAIKNGASGYLLKDMEPDDLYQMLLKVHRGEAAINGMLASRILHEFRHSDDRDDALKRLQRLTERERLVLERLVQGDNNREIALALSISENTVKSHLCNIMEKLHLRNRVQTAVYAVAKGLVDYRPEE